MLGEFTAIGFSGQADLPPWYFDYLEPFGLLLAGIIGIALMIWFDTTRRSLSHWLARFILVTLILAGLIFADPDNWFASYAMRRVSVVFRVVHGMGVISLAVAIAVAVEYAIVVLAGRKSYRDR